MFDGIHRPEVQAPKPKSAAWAQEVTEVHTNPKSKTFHPVKNVKIGHSSRMPILLVILFLVFLGAGIYFWWMNKNIKETPIVVADNIIATVEEKVVEEEIAEEEIIEEDEAVDEGVALVFPNDYFLSIDEVPEGMERDGINSDKMDFDDLPALDYLYDSADSELVTEAWNVSYRLPEQVRGIQIVMVKYDSSDSADAEVDKILETKTSLLLRASTRVMFLRKNDVIIALSSDMENHVELELLVDVFEDKLETIRIKTLTWSLGEIEASGEDWLSCYLVINPEQMNNFPETALKADFEELGNLNIVERESLIEENCSFFDESNLQAQQFSKTFETDVDGDGLVLFFEFVYNSSDDNSDTDGDGYNDLMELENGYSPIFDESSAEEYTSETGQKYMTYIDEDFGYSILRPRDWSAGMTNYSEQLGDLSVLMPGLEFSNDYFGNNMERIKVSASIWEDSLENSIQDFVPKSGWEEIVFAGMPAYKKSDGTGILLFKESSEEGSTEMYALMHYYDENIGPDQEYMETFQEMLDSFKFLE